MQATIPPNALIGSLALAFKKDWSADLFEDLIEATSVVTNSFATTFNIGGTTASTPRVKVELPKCHFEVPSHSIDDIISLEVAFHALPASVDPSSADNFEAKGTYFGA